MSRSERKQSEGTERIPFPEYPRPQLFRGSFFNLNGMWEYAIRKTGKPLGTPDGTILVPYSPETELSGVKRTLMPGETLFYRKRVALPEAFLKNRAILHFGAVDMDCAVFVNGQKLGEHRGGFNAFSFNATEFLRENENEFVVAVTDETDAGYRTRSKQTFRRGGIWYSPTSGIWQTVWLEAVPERYVERLEILPDFDGASVTVRAFGKNLGKIRVAVTENPYFETEPETSETTGAPDEKAEPFKRIETKSGEPANTELAAAGEAAVRERAGIDPGDQKSGTDGPAALVSAEADGAVTLPLGAFKAWSPERPKLYGLTVSTDTDTVKSYFGMRKFEVRRDGKGIPRFFLNNKPYFIHGLLDQGYWDGGMYTPPDDEAFQNDILTAKRLGFNALRKHIKVEPKRWYFHADRLGILVLQDMPSGGTRYKNRVTLYYPFVGIRLEDDRYRLFGRENPASRAEFESEYREMLSALQNAVSIAVWVPFNEGWGQFDANRIAALTKRLDPTRPVDHASGWHDQGGGDFKSLHIYFKPVPKIRPEETRAALLSEFGGYSLKIPGHVFDENKTFGYQVFKDRDSLNRAFSALYRKEVVAHIAEGLSGDVYTELSDVEDEVNGVTTFDRAEVKIDAETGARVKAEIDAAFSAACGEPIGKGEIR